jgi:hypothetical protein
MADTTITRRLIWITIHGVDREGEFQYLWHQNAWAHKFDASICLEERAVSSLNQDSKSWTIVFEVSHSQPDQSTKPSMKRTMANTIIIRPARLADIKTMTDVFFDSFNQEFWTSILPDNSSNRSFIDEMWKKGMYASTDRTFVAVDTADSNRVIGVSRWQAPLYDRKPEVCDSWPEPSMLDQDTAVSLFRAEDLSRRTIMGDRPHWCE